MKTKITMEMNRLDVATIAAEVIAEKENYDVEQVDTSGHTVIIKFTDRY